MSKNCLNEETLTSYLEDSLRVSARAAVEEHLISCDACRSRLVYYMRILDDDVREEEEPVVAAAMTDWDPTRIPASTGNRNPSTRSVLPRAILAASVLIAVTLGVLLRLETPAELGGAEFLEEFLRQNRPFPSRTSLQDTGEDWTEFVETRAGAVSSGVNTVGLDVLTGETAAGGGDDHIRGLGFLVQKNWDEALSYLQTAEQAKLDAAVENDLGVVYLERFKEGQDAENEDFGQAQRRFRDALDLDAAFLPARFNLILLSRKMGMNAEAEYQLALYLEADPDSEWAAEAIDIVRED